MKMLTNFYYTKILKGNLDKVKDESITYSDVQTFYKDENFTKDSVDKN